MLFAAFSADGAFVATAARQFGEFSGSCLVFTKDCVKMLSALRDATVRTWDTKTGRSRCLLEGHRAKEAKSKLKHSDSLEAKISVGAFVEMF